MILYNQIIIILLYSSILLLNGQSQEIIELPNEVSTDAINDTRSGLPNNVQLNGTNSSFLHNVGSVSNSSSVPPVTVTSSNTTSAASDAATAIPSDQFTYSSNVTTSITTNISTFENETNAINQTTTLSFEDTLQNFTLDSSNSTTPETPTGPPSSGDAGDYADHLGVRRGMFLDDYCTCDIKVDSCDVGCCCDSDCSGDDVGAFAGCLTAPRPLAGDSRYCVQRWVLQHHNTEYTVDTANPNLFCIVTDNHVHRTFFPPLKVIRTNEDFQKIQRGFRKTYQFFGDQRTTATLPSNTPYQQGDLVWGVSRNGRLFPIGLPSSMFTSSCETETKLKYLSDFTTVCQRQILLRDLKKTKDGALDPSSYINFYVLLQPSLLFKQKEEQQPSTSEPTTQSTTVTSTSAWLSTIVTTDNSTNLSSTTPVNATSAADVSSSSTTLAPSSESSALLAYTEKSNSTITSSNNTGDVGKDSSLSYTTRFTNQVPLNKSDNLPNTRAKLMSLENLAPHEEDSSFFNETLLCKVRVVLCLNTQPDMVCYNAAERKPLLTQCDIVTEVSYIILHNGSGGIKSVTANITVKNVCNGKTPSQISQYEYLTVENSEPVYNLKQKFTVEYRWAQSEETVVFAHSGRPGYLRGKPLLFGHIVSNFSDEGLLVHAIARDTDPMRGLTVIRGGPLGDCNTRIPVTFGENLKTQCTMHVTPEDIMHNCTQLRQRIRYTHLGDVLDDTEKDLRIGAYGDSDVLLPPQWVPLLRTRDTSRPYSTDDLSEDGHCLDLLTSITIEVAFALQGSLANPQAKVVGALLTEGPLRPSPPVGCVGPFCRENMYTMSGDPYRDEENIVVYEPQEENEDHGCGKTVASNASLGVSGKERSGKAGINFYNTTAKPSVNKNLAKEPNETAFLDEQQKSYVLHSRSTHSSGIHMIAIELSTAVIFIDVTEPSEPMFPDPPHLNMKLPDNFFYPLVPSGTGSSFGAGIFIYPFCLIIALYLIF